MRLRAQALSAFAAVALIVCSRTRVGPFPRLSAFWSWSRLHGYSMSPAAFSDDTWTFTSLFARQLDGVLVKSVSATLLSIHPRSASMAPCQLKLPKGEEAAALLAKLPLPDGVLEVGFFLNSVLGDAQASFFSRLSTVIPAMRALSSSPLSFFLVWLYASSPFPPSSVVPPSLLFRVSYFLLTLFLVLRLSHTHMVFPFFPSAITHTRYWSLSQRRCFAVA